MPGALVIIDMQVHFIGPFAKRAIGAIQREINFAKRANDMIILLEYDGYGPTVKPILRTIGDYEHHVVTKVIDDGSSYLKKYLPEKPSYIKIAGVNAGACVRQTVMGLKQCYSNIVLIADGIDYNPGYCDDDEHRARVLKTISTFGVFSQNVDTLLQPKRRLAKTAHSTS